MIRIGNLRQIAFSLLFCFAFSAIGCDKSDSVVVKPKYRDSQIDSVLNSLVPSYKYVSPGFKEWFSLQKEAIARDSLSPYVIAKVVGWHRREISRLTKLEGYVTYPLVERMPLSAALDSLLPLTIAELNTRPHCKERVVFLPWAGDGVVFDSLPQESFKEILKRSGHTVDSEEKFYKTCLAFLEIAFPDPQIILTSERQWQIFYLADSLVRKVPDSLDLAFELMERISLLPTVDRLDTLSEAVVFANYFDLQPDGWVGIPRLRNIVNVAPHLRNDIYRTEITVLDSYRFMVIHYLFYYDTLSKTFWFEERRKVQPRRKRVYIFGGDN